MKMTKLGQSLGLVALLISLLISQVQAQDPRIVNPSKADANQNHVSDVLEERLIQESNQIQDDTDPKLDLLVALDHPPSDTDRELITRYKGQILQEWKELACAVRISLPTSAVYQLAKERGVVLVSVALASSGASAGRAALLFACFGVGAAAALAVVLAAGGRAIHATRRFASVEIWLRRLAGGASLGMVAVLALGWDAPLLSHAGLVRTAAAEELLLGRLAPDASGVVARMARAADRPPPPPAIDPGAQQMVQEIVLPGDRVEHARDFCGRS
jgi:hypothetical protein